jgi:plasmid stabilization system protein ParE
MSGYQFTPQALQDLFDISDFISQDNPSAAERVENAIFRACSLLADSPLAGRARSDITQLPVRFWVVQPFTRYFLVYDADSKPLRIIRICMLPGISKIC